MKPNSIFIFLFLLALSLLFFSCENKQPLEQISDSEIQICDFTGIKIPDDTGLEFQFIQTITWDYSHDEALFAIRIQTTNNELPENINVNENGWIIWQNDSIWTEERSFSYQFQSQFGNLEHIISRVELKSFYNNLESEIQDVSFFDYREIGTVINSRGGDIHEKTIGKAVEIYMLENIEDIFVDGLYADYFMYRLNIIDENTLEVISEGEWFNSINQENIRKVFLNEYTEPALNVNEVGELTQFETYVVTKSGHVDSANPAAIHFSVSDQFSPETLLYLQNSFILGEHHYANSLPYYYSNQSTMMNIPSENINGEIHYGMPFWMDTEMNYSVIGDEDTEFYFHSGWKGEYQQNDPLGQYQGIVLDRTTNINYGSWINYIDYRMDNNPLQLPYEHTFNTVADTDGTSWLRIPITAIQAQKLHLQNLAVGQHLLEIRVVDSQMKPDEMPVAFEFTIHEYIPPENREGILLVNNVYPNTNLPSVEEMYSEVFNYLNVAYQMIEYDVMPYSSMHYGNNNISPTDMQQYKLVVYNQDIQPDSWAHFSKEFITLSLYQQLGGNLLLSGGKNIWDSYTSDYNNGTQFFNKFFSIGTGEEDISFFGANSFQNPYFISAIPDNDFETELHLEMDPANVFHPIINIAHGLGAIAKFNSFTSTVIYRYGAKLPGTDNYSPSEEWYDEFNGFPVALKDEKANGSKCYLFGFPLLYMEIDGIKSLYQEIWNDLD
jgi:hypothetical protein